MSNYASMEREVNMWKALDTEEIFNRVLMSVFYNEEECLNWFLMDCDDDLLELCFLVDIERIQIDMYDYDLSIEDAYAKIIALREEIYAVIKRFYNGAHSRPINEICHDLPMAVKRLFINTDCTLTMVDCIEGAPTASGVFMHNNEIHHYAIEIKRNADFTRENVAYHEFGHLLDYGYGESFRSNSKIFMEIFEAEKNNFTVDDNYEYYITNPQEYFAQAFAEYMLNPDRLRDNTPMTYEYVKHLLNITELEEVIYAKQIVRNRKFRKVCKDISEAGKDVSEWEQFKMIIRYHWHHEETLCGKVKSIAKIIFGR